MSARTPLSFGLIAAGTLALAAIASLVGPASPAHAHNSLIASTPAAGETLTAIPERFSVTTNEPMLALPGSNGFVLQIRDAAGLFYGDGCVEVVDATMSAEAALGGPGAYTMLWQAVSADGHSIDGEVPFTWEPSGVGAGDDPGAEVSAGSAAPPVCGEAAVPNPTATAGPAPTSSEPTAAPETASEFDASTALWIGGALLAAGIAVAVAIVIASRRRT